MRRGLAVISVFLLVAAATSVALAAGRAPSSHSVSKQEERAILNTARFGRDAVLSDRPATICQLLTARAQRNSLILDGIDHDTQGRPRRTPTTCTQAVGDMIDDVRATGDLRDARRIPQSVRLTLIRVRGRYARLAVGSGVYRSLEIRLRHTAAGWRGDSANFAPFDGSSGY